MTVIERVLEHLDNVRPNGAGYQARCPGHDDENPSLSVTEGDSGQVLMHCHAGCKKEAILEAAGLAWRDLYPPEIRNGHRRVAETYDYTDENGSLLFQVVRFDPKDFRQRQPDKNGGWAWNLKGIEPTLYRLPEALKAVREGNPVLVVEGEKDVHRLEAEGLTATTCPMGAAKWRASYSESLAGADAIIIPDNDVAGRAHGQQVARSLQGKTKSVRVVELPGVPEGGDVSDWFDAGGTVEKLLKLPSLETPGSASATLSARDLLAMDLPAVRWIVPGILPEGVSLLAGKPKMGKSWMAYGVAVAVASGGVALGTRRVERGEVLYLALEDNHRRLQKRLGKLLNGSEAPEGLFLATTWSRLDEGGVEELDAWLTTHPDCRLVVVDTLKKLRTRANGNRSLYDVDYEALEPLLPLAAEHGIAVMVVHHLRKMDADDPMDTISGSTGLTGGVDGALVLKRDRGKADAYLHVDGRDVEEPCELALKWDANLASWTIVGDAEEYRTSTAKAKTLEVLEEAGEPMTPTEVADALGQSSNTVKQRLWRMSRDGEIKNDGGRYSLNNRNPRTPVTETDEHGYRVTEVTGFVGEETFGEETF